MFRRRQSPVFWLLLAASTAVAQRSDPQTGAFRMTDTLAGIAGEEVAARVADVIRTDEPITWEIYVPPHYDPADPPGLMVYISPTRSGKIPNDWELVMDEYNLIWVAANQSGNLASVGRRTIIARVAPALVARSYAVDPERVYVTGFSGGARMASMVAIEHADLFKGAIYNCGVNFWDKQTPRHIDLVRDNHYVFITGTYDGALKPTLRIHRKYLEAGVENAKLMVIREMTHRNPNRYDFAEAVAYLDARIGQITERTDTQDYPQR